MAEQSSLAKISFAVGMVLFIGGNLLLCYCSVPFILAAASFGIAAIASKRLLRIIAIIFIPASIGMAIQHADMEAEMRANALEASRQAEAREKLNADKPESEPAN
jgi:hypothetical protein